MTLDEYNRFCASLPRTTHLVQWGGAHVWKVGGKVFAIGGWAQRSPSPLAGEGRGGGKDVARDALAVTFKVSPASFDILSEQPGLRPAPYLASRGMKWIQRQTDETMDDAALCDYLAESHRLVAEGLTRKQQRELGLAQD
jgi:predicted DNA-binding protein (MmcQ/YjbR family)